MIDYILVKQGTNEHSMLLNRVFLDRQVERSTLNYKKSQLRSMPVEVVEQVESAMDEVERVNASLRDGEPVDNDENQRQSHGNDIYLPTRANPTRANPTGDGKVYEMVIGWHPDEREVRGAKAGCKKPKFRKMSERD